MYIDNIQAPATLWWNAAILNRAPAAHPETTGSCALENIDSKNTGRVARQQADVHRRHLTMTITSVLFKVHFAESVVVDSALSIRMEVVPAAAVVRILKW